MLNKAVDELKSALEIEAVRAFALLRDICDETRVDVLNSIIEYINKLQGKKIRSLVLLAFAKLIPQEKKAQYEDYYMPTHYLAGAVELIHLATLLHDDVIDSGVTRRGYPTINSRWGGNIAILVGDYVFSQAFKFIVASECPTAMRVLSKTAAIISAGEIWQLDLLWDLKINQNTYFELISSKTSELFGAAAECGLLAAGVSDPNYTQIARDFGLLFGRIFQIYDDLLDYYGNEELLGKKVGMDIAEGKITMPVIEVVNVANGSEFELLKTLLYEIKLQNIAPLVFIETIYKLTVKYGVDQIISSKLNFYISQCVSILNKFPQSDLRNRLISLTQAMSDVGTLIRDQCHQYMNMQSETYGI